jgi:hypothetical protein
MTESDWVLLSNWLLHGPGALLSADELRETFADAAKRWRLVEELRTKRARPTT